MIRGLNDVATAAAVRDTGRRRADSVEGRIKKLLKAKALMLGWEQDVVTMYGAEARSSRRKRERER